MRQHTEAWSTASVALAVLACAFQLLATVKISGNDVRLAVADLAMPPLLMLAVWQWWRGSLPHPSWHMRHLPWWLAALSVLLAWELFAGRSFTGGWQKWALVNKFAGWFQLIGFLLIGAWVAQQATERDRLLFVRLLLLVAATICVFDLIRYLSHDPYYQRLEGRAGNPNSFGYLLAVVAVVSLAQHRARQLFRPVLTVGLFALVLTGIVFSGSRSAWLGFGAGLLWLVVTRSLPWRLLIASMGVAAVLSALTMTMLEVGGLDAIIVGNSTVSHLTPNYLARDNILVDTGVSHRLRITQHALSLWSQSPILGIGLGGFYWADVQENGSNGATIHNSALWLLTETGIAGCLLFAGFFLCCAIALWRAYRQGALDPLAIGAFAALAVFVGASMGIEALYQRHLWFLAGYALLLRPGSKSLSDSKRV